MIDGERYRVRDLGSKNGSLVGNVAVLDALVKSGTILTLGNTQLRVELETGEQEVPASRTASFGGLLGASPAMREVFAQLERAATSNVTVLLEGETGTGKELAAEALHTVSPRSRGPFVVIDCGAIPVSLLESELFGHERGAFTGAVEQRIGAFEEASGGTLVLDEIGELSPDLQPKLLRALETRQIRRIGGRDVIDCDVRIIAATNRDLRAEVNAGTFRPDLYYRLAVLRIGLPPLRARPDDLPLLIAYLLDRLGADPASVVELTAPDFVAALARAPWPGNVRELRNHLEQCLVLRERRLPGEDGVRSTGVDPTLTYDAARQRAIEVFERDFVRQIVARADGNVAQAASDAGMNRAYLYRLLARYR